MDLQIFTDGASRGNPGPAAAAFVFIQEKNLIFENAVFLGEKTNNQAEYQAIVLALKEAQKFKGSTIILSSDSELVVKQLNGDYQVKDSSLKKLNTDVMKLCKSFEQVIFVHSPRTDRWISYTDKLCNKALNRN